LSVRLQRFALLAGADKGCVIPSDAKANECLGLPQPVRPRMLFHYTHPRAEIIAEKL
jgi:hypothetical protein